MHILPAYLSLLRFFVFLLTATYAYAGSSLDPETIVKEMQKAYSSVKDYRAKMEVRTYETDGSFDADRFLYTFKKPKSIRLDFESPHSGMVLIYPDKNGKAVIRPSGLARFFKLRLAPDNPLLGVSSGQPINKTDMGLLIDNISRSVTDWRRGPASVLESNDHIRIRVLSLNHFRKDVVTLYEFVIDKNLWLPVKLSESTPGGQLERTITFEDLKTNAGVPDGIFRLDEDKKEGNETIERK